MLVIVIAGMTRISDGNYFWVDFNHPNSSRRHHLFRLPVTGH